MSDTRKITESRKATREAAQSPEWRQIQALEDIADALEALRADIKGLPKELAASLQKVLSK